MTSFYYMNFFTQLFRYSIVGGIAFIVDFGLLYSLTEWLNFYYLLSATLSFIAGLIVNYTLSTKWVFYQSSIQNKGAEFLAFSLIGVAGLGINNLVLWGLTAGLSLHYMFSKIFTTIVVFAWNFLARKYLIFNPKQSAIETRSDTQTILNN